MQIPPNLSISSGLLTTPVRMASHGLDSASLIKNNQLVFIKYNFFGTNQYLEHLVVQQ